MYIDEITLDTSVALKPYVLVDQETYELGTDWEYTPEQVAHLNGELASQGSRWRWHPWAEEAAAA